MISYRKGGVYWLLPRLLVLRVLSGYCSALKYVPSIVNIYVCSVYVLFFCASRKLVFRLCNACSFSACITSKCYPALHALNISTFDSALRALNIFSGSGFPKHGNSNSMSVHEMISLSSSQGQVWIRRLCFALLCFALLCVCVCVFALRCRRKPVKAKVSGSGSRAQPQAKSSSSSAAEPEGSKATKPPRLPRYLLRAERCAEWEYQWATIW